MGDRPEAPFDAEEALGRPALGVGGAVADALAVAACGGLPGVEFAGASVARLDSASFSVGSPGGFPSIARPGSEGLGGAGVAGSGSEPKSQGVES